MIWSVSDSPLMFGDIMLVPWITYSGFMPQFILVASSTVGIGLIGKTLNRKARVFTEVI